MRPMLPAPRARHIPKDLIDMPITTRGKRLPLPQFACPCGSERGSTIVCDGCDATFHLRCLHRKRMPVGLWFCSSCNDSRAQDLEERIPDSLKARLGEVCWVDWGDGFGWWPCIVCHPLWMKGKAADEAFAMASEYLLVNFLGLPNPLTIVKPEYVMPWEDGLKMFFIRDGEEAKKCSDEQFAIFKKAYSLGSKLFCMSMEERAKKVAMAKDPIRIEDSKVAAAKPTASNQATVTPSKRDSPDSMPDVVPTSPQKKLRVVPPSGDNKEMMESPVKTTNGSANATSALVSPIRDWESPAVAAMENMKEAPMEPYPDACVSLEPAFQGEEEEESEAEEEAAEEEEEEASLEPAFHEALEGVEVRAESTSPIYHEVMEEEEEAQVAQDDWNPQYMIQIPFYLMGKVVEILYESVRSAFTGGH